VVIWSKQTKRSESIDSWSPDLVPQVEALASRLDAQSQDVYVGASLMIAGHKGRGSQTEAVAMPGFWLDLDLHDPNAHKSAKLPTTLEDAAQILAPFPEPTMVVHSGYGLHVWWCFDQPLELTPDDIPHAEAALKSFQGHIIKHAASLGWHVDATGDLPRVLRVPGTRNHKDPTNPKPVEVIDADGPRHDVVKLLTFEPSGPGASLAGQAQGTPKLVVPGPVGPTNVPPATLPPVKTTAEYLEKLNNITLKAKDSKAMLKQILAGESFGDLGERDVKLHKACSILAYLFPEASPDLLVPILAKSLMTWDVDDTGKFTQEDRLAWAHEKMDAALGDSRVNLARKQAQEREIRDALTNEARKAPDPTLPEGEPAPSGDYTEAEISRWAKDQGVTPPTEKAFRSRWIIQKGQSFFVFANGNYKRPIQANELELSLPRDLAPAPIIWTVPKADDSGDRDKKLNELLADYGTVARDLTSDMTLQRSYYDSATETFHEAVTPIRRIVPRFIPEIDTWLRHLGGVHADVLLDWVATVTNLSEVSAALYLAGAGGTGKTMLAHGLARLWTTGGPTELDRILGNWTSDLASCPLILADEDLAATHNGRPTSAVLRDLVACKARTLTRKYVSNAKLVGSIRLVMTANHDNMLAFGDEDLNADGLDAVAGRFLHIPVDSKAKDYLEAQGGPTFTKLWVDGDMIASHALWLAKNRTVARGARFLVEGTTTSMHQNLAIQTTGASVVCEALANYLQDPTKVRPGTPIAKGIRAGNGKLLVNVTALQGLIALYLDPRMKVPNTKRLGMALSNMSNKTQVLRDHGKIRLWDVKPALVLAWADQVSFGSPEVMRAQIDAQVVLDSDSVEEQAN